ncbi:hypothetical protein VPH35_074332 [Triticum aestivum]
MEALAPTPPSSATLPRRLASPEITTTVTRSRRRTCLLLLPLLHPSLPSFSLPLIAAPPWLPQGSPAAAPTSLRPQLQRDPAAPARIRILRSAAPRIWPPPSLPRRSARPPASPCLIRVDG